MIRLKAVGIINDCNFINYDQVYRRWIVARWVVMMHSGLEASKVAISSRSIGSIRIAWISNSIRPTSAGPPFFQRQQMPEGHWKHRACKLRFPLFWFDLMLLAPLDASCWAAQHKPAKHCSWTRSSKSISENDQHCKHPHRRHAQWALLIENISTNIFIANAESFNLVESGTYLDIC